MTPASFFNFIDLEQDQQTTSLERVESIQDLGVLVDERLSFSEHMQVKINKAYATLGVIKRNFKYLKTSSFILLYKNMVRSHLDYCSLQCMVAIQKRRHGGYRGSEKGN